MDLYRETIEGDRYLHDGAWLDLELQDETIEVAGGDPVNFTIRKTHHGPLIEDDIALWWTYTQYPDNRIHEAFFGFSRAKDMADVERSAALIHAPGINLMYGDDSGNIAWWASAKLPVRPAHVDTKTAIDGTDSTNDPTGWYPFAFNPQSVNPPSGYVYSANNAPDSVKGVYHPGHYYSGNTRGAGIIGAIEAKDDWTLADAQALQLDHHSPVYTRNCAMLVALADASNETFTAEVSEALESLRNWDGSHTGEQTEPTLYYRWMYRTIQGAMEDEFIQAAGAEAAEKFETWHRTIASENSFPRLLQNPASPWWDHAATEETEGIADIAATALTQAHADLRETLGHDPAN